ncbi:SYF2 splicing factor-domain-containing protein [Podospora didyma]|uniref:Pre-mRNA-splicing factor SYF2 n=1 Tax=Podospora didyma TaxID=330526 RepID=A0AAE0NAA7_9PEZI|nr:SYF2 splicing factor-domain-containing protein [Podospora didyma]
MPPAKKRKVASGKSKAVPEKEAIDQSSDTVMAVEQQQQPEPTSEPAAEPTPAPAPIPAPASAPAEAKPVAEPVEEEPAPPPPATASSSFTPAPASTADSTAEAAAKAQERMARFRALQARAKTSSDQNLKEATRESQRLAADPTKLTALGRKHAIASHKLLKADVEDEGGDFERKRAWDWTIEETERWDKRTKKRDAHRDDTAFRDYGHESKKAYKRQLRNMGAPDLERYTRDKMAAIEKAAAAGTLEIVETDDGEMIAVDKDGTFFSTADSTTFAQHRPDKAAVDRLVADLRKAEEATLKKRAQRMAKNGDDGDVTYINEKNKQFNQKLERFYNKYTADIRDSFERGTMV